MRSILFLVFVALSPATAKHVRSKPTSSYGDFILRAKRLEEEGRRPPGLETLTVAVPERRIFPPVPLPHVAFTGPITELVRSRAIEMNVRTDSRASLAARFAALTPLPSIGLFYNGAPTLTNLLFPPITGVDDVDLFDSVLAFTVTGLDGPAGSFGTVIGPYTVTIGGHSRRAIFKISARFSKSLIGPLSPGETEVEEKVRQMGTGFDSPWGILRFLMEVDLQDQASRLRLGTIPIAPLVYGGWLLKSGDAYYTLFAMEYIPGGTARKLVPEAPLDISEVPPAKMAQISAFCDPAHAIIELLNVNGILHRDTHRENFLVVPHYPPPVIPQGPVAPDITVTAEEPMWDTCVVKIIDFGESLPLIPQVTSDLVDDDFKLGCPA